MGRRVRMLRSIPSRSISTARNRASSANIENQRCRRKGDHPSNQIPFRRQERRGRGRGRGRERGGARNPAAVGVNFHQRREKRVWLRLIIDADRSRVGSGRVGSLFREISRWVGGVVWCGVVWCGGGRRAAAAAAVGRGHSFCLRLAAMTGN
jgi:hypothetical protein